MNLNKTLVALVAALTFLCPFVASAQFQNFKGTVLDKAIQSPLVGATVRIRNGEGQVSGAVTDLNGKFRVEHLPVGAYSLEITYTGYKDFFAQNIALIAGKETDLTIEMDESVVAGKEVIITAKADKKKPLNDFSTVSTRTFSVEETNRFAAAVNDPARMAMSFAGVVAGHDGNNIISVRGNSPNGLLWRMEGMDIPNPNHFTAAGTSGGGISIVSAQLLSNSDFSSGAFAAEYGNALSGIFDLKLRKGNMDKYEYTFKASVLGMDAAAEGPLKIGTQKGSFLVNYRYSTLALLADAGVPIDGAPVFQDLSFNVFLPAGKAGNFSLFGFGGLSNANSDGSRDTSEWAPSSYLNYDFLYHSNTGVAGLKHNLQIGSKSFLTNTISVSGTDFGDGVSEILLPDFRTEPRYANSTKEKKLRFSSVLTQKFNARNLVKFGADYSLVQFETSEDLWDWENKVMYTNFRQDGSTGIANAFVQWNYRPTEKITFNAGMHGLFFQLNQQFSAEPRAALSYQISKRQSVSFGYGLHGQTQPLGNYFIRNAAGQEINRDMNLSKAHHFVLGYDRSLSANMRLKTELYYQHLFDIPVAADPNSTFSMLNLVENFADQPLVNEGLGRNYGIELTLEHFLHNGFYFLLSSSLYKAEYQALDPVWRHTRFDASLANSLTAGKEWDWSTFRKNRSLGVNIRIIQVGGFRETPLDVAATHEAGYLIFDEKNAFTQRVPGYFRADAGVHIKRNYKRLTTTLSLDIQNVTNRKNVFINDYDPNTFEKTTIYQAPLIPVLAYKVQF